MTTINLTQEAYISGYNGAFLRHINEDGTLAPTGISNSWYEAAASDAEGNEYQVYWEITGNLDDEDASDHCNWDAPYMVISAGKNVTLSVIIAN